MPPIADDITAVRAFNRFYTRRLGVLDQQILKSPFSLTEARVLYELARRDSRTAKEIAAELGLDAGYLSRIVQTLLDRAIISRTPLPSDRRQQQLSLTAKGRLTAGRLDLASQDEIAEMLTALPPGDSRRVANAMTAIRRILDPKGDPSRNVTLRSHRPGDMGWVVQQHGALYAGEYGWDISFEALVAEIVAQFLKNFDAAGERCWIAEGDGRQAGSVFLVRDSAEIAKLRLLLVHPDARGMGLGKRLVDECISFSRNCGYRKITLWTQSMLVAARTIYVEAGFERIAATPHTSFGHDLIGETWELAL